MVGHTVFFLMDRGIPTEEHLENMRARNISYLVGTPKGRLTKLEKALATLPWHKAREAVEVKLLAQDQEFYVLVQSQARVSKERAMRRGRLKRLWKRLKELQLELPSYETLLLKLGILPARKRVARGHWSSSRYPRRHLNKSGLGAWISASRSIKPSCA
jgi:hypothetical protein